ncbi:hypothetical protein [Flavobacterium silvaticum]|uniref:Lipocalin-like domain-containing protein n=1 Tax=Flavobacterium silvaticum TaxID=1852020 RepID=A0A972FKE4_9FLAO|nr:hypothetical protein [Flavobacterium silvaticum]NMH27601.1 hypothetical protein [Flavobacterium silvaticum]
MKYIFTTLLLLAMKSDSQLNYNLILGTWTQKALEKNGYEGVFTFNSDSTATIEMRQGQNGAVMGSLSGTYSLKKSEGKMTMKMFGEEKLFSLIRLEADSMVVKNISQNKPEMTLVRYKSK